MLEWIDCSISFPKEMIKVLIFLSTGHIEFGRIREGHWEFLGEAIADYWEELEPNQVKAWAYIDYKDEKNESNQKASNAAAAKRYIDAYALENRVEDFEKLTGIKLDIVHDFVSSEPTADVRENVRGEWLDYQDNPIKFYFDGRYSAHCSVCGYHPEYEEEMRNANFCPNCGAQMKEE